MALSLTVISVTAALLSFTLPTVIVPGPLGLFSSLNSVYVAGFTVCLVSIGLSIYGRATGRQIALQAFVMELYLWVIPLIFMPGLRFPAAYHDLFFYSSTASISITGHLNPSTYTYQSWPAPYIFAATLKILLPSISYLQIYHFVPFATNLFVSLIVYVLFRAYLPVRHAGLAVLGVVFFELFNYTEQFTTVSPFTTGNLLFYALAFPLLVGWIKGRALTWQQTVIFVAFMGSISVTHPVVAIELIFAAAAVPLLIGFRHAKMRNTSFLYVTIGLAMVILWSFTGGEPIIGNYGAYILNEFLKFTTGVVAPAVIELTTVSPAHLFVNHVRLAVLVAILGAATPSILVNVRKKTEFRILLSFLIGLLGSAILLGEVEGPSLFTYLLCAALPLFLLFDLLSLTLVRRRYLVVVTMAVLIVSAPISILVLYGNLQSESLSSASLTAGVFYSQFAPRGTTSQTNTIAGFTGIGLYGVDLGTILPFTNGGFSYSDFSASHRLQFIGFSQDAVAYTLFTFGNLSSLTSAYSYVNQSSAYALVYSSSYDTIFTFTQS